ncbi:MAG: glycosyltransferase, partial [Gammaproteobacteria bacterium]
YEDLASLLLANTVTGAASLFRRGLLDLVLPFPMRVGDSLHDHWIACVALTLGRIKYIDEPLHDYVQHGDNVLGHFAPHRNGRRSEVRRFLRAVPGSRNGRPARVARWEAIYFNDLTRLKLIAKTLELRCGMINGHKRQSLRRIARLDESVPAAGWLVARSLRHRHKLTTLGAENRLISALFWRRLLPTSRAPQARGVDVRDVSPDLPTVASELAASEKVVSQRDSGIENLEDEIASLQKELSATRAELAASEAVVSELRNEIAVIHQSRSWRLHSLSHAIVAQVKRARLYFGRDVEARPHAGLEAIAIDGRITEWMLTDDDPQFDLVWSKPDRLPPGRYRLTLEMPDGEEDLVLPRLYVDSGAGMSEVDRIDLHFQVAAAGEVTAHVALPRAVFKLRFDPSITPGKLSLGRIRIRRLCRLEPDGGLIGILSAALLKNPISGVRAAERALETSTNGVHGVVACLPEEQMTKPAEYQSWIQRHDQLTEVKLTGLRRRLEALDDPPLISVVMPVHNTPEKLLREAIESVRAQIYDRWELCIADDCSTELHVRKILDEYAKDDPRIKVVYRDENGHISRATNSAFDLASGSWVALLDHDDLLRPHSLAEVVLEIADHPDTELIYSDEDKLDAEGRRYDPYFKPEFSRELFRSQNYLNHLTVHRAENIRAVGGWRPGFEGSQDYDLNLRILECIDMASIRHVPKILYHWRAVEGSVATSNDEKNYANTAALRALEEHVARLDLPAKVEPAPGTPFYRLRFSVPEPQPLVSLIIPTRDNVDLLRGCVE